ncbi:MAG: cyclopropane-fatty-acyl-phospholipid synthase family protein [Pseudomonadota bacterium]
MLDRYITQRFIDALRHIEYGAITVVTPDGKEHFISGNKPGTQANLTLHDWRAVSAIAQRGDIGFAEAYRDGWWDSTNLSDLFLASLKNETVLNKYIYGNMIGRIVSRVAYAFTRNTLSGSRKNIHAHYDLGNDFYALWLDPTMTYSSAIFNHPDESLISAQYNKYDRIIDRIDNSGNMLEIGCGWGGFAERALQKRDYKIKGLTISKEQHDYAVNRLRNSAQIALEDYRLQEGKYNSIVSIEMFEAVGEQFWPTYFSKIKSLLADDGKAVIQTITIKDAYFERYRKGGDAIRTFIFPGGMLPSPKRFAEESASHGLLITDRLDFGQDYARTLEHWLERFEARREEIRHMGFDGKFIRMWRFYLTCCIASFKDGRTNVMQVELQHAA